jgi:Sulfotransferase family
MIDGSRPPIFIVGCQRSGTTLLRLILDAHPNISCGPETLFLVEFAERLTGARHWQHLEHFGFPKQYWQQRVAALFDTVQGDYARRRGKARWADKTPLYALAIPFLAEVFPDAQIVHVIRDGRDVALSVLDRTVRDLTAADVARRWQKKITKAREDAPQLDHYMEIRYEDLILDTEPVLRRVAEFCELPWDDAMLEYHERSGERLKEMARALPGDGRAKELSVERRMATHAMTTKPPSADRVARWRTQMPAAQRAEFEAIAGELLAELGYPVGDSAVEEATAQIEAA